MRQYARLFVLVALIIGKTPSFAQHASLMESGNGNSNATALARALGSLAQAHIETQAKYPTDTVSLLAVKQMCQGLGVRTSGVKARIDELLTTGTPCIIGLRGPDRFLVLLDGSHDELRVLDGEVASLRVVHRRDIEQRFTGYALVPEVSSTANAPRIQMPQFDQYVVFKGIGQEVKYHFPFRNTGKMPLTVEVAGTSCGCTAALLKGDNGDQIILPPSHSSELIVSYAVQTQASIQQTVTLKTNDPLRREIYLSIRGQVQPQLMLLPPALFVQQPAGEEPNKVFKVIGPDGARIKSIHSNLPYLNFKVGPREKIHGQVIWPVAIYGFAAAPVGPIKGKIFVMLRDSKELWVPVRGEVEEPGLPGASEAASLPRAEDGPASSIALATPRVEVGHVAPDFSVTDMSGRSWKLSGLKGKKNLLLTFFPKCFTGGCANHLSSLRDRQAEFDKSDTQILAVSVDAAVGEKGQEAFAEQWKLGFPLIPDTTRRLSMLYGATQNDKQLDARMSVLVDKKGIIRWIDTDVHVQTHGEDVLAKMRELGMTP